MSLQWNEIVFMTDCNNNKTSKKVSEPRSDYDTRSSNSIF